jgi:hypothetical protein
VVKPQKHLRPSALIRGKNSEEDKTHFTEANGDNGENCEDGARQSNALRSID